MLCCPNPGLRDALPCGYGDVGGKVVAPGYDVMEAELCDVEKSGDGVGRSPCWCWAEYAGSLGGTASYAPFLPPLVAPPAFLFFWLLRRRMQKTSRPAKIATAASPPTTPPTIAPVLDPEEEPPLLLVVVEEMEDDVVVDTEMEECEVREDELVRESRTNCGSSIMAMMVAVGKQRNMERAGVLQRKVPHSPKEDVWL